MPLYKQQDSSETKVVQFRVFELDMEGPHSHCNVSPIVRSTCNYEHDLAKKKAAGATSSDLRPIWLPTLGNLRNFLLTCGVKLSELQVLFSSQ